MASDETLSGVLERLIYHNEENHFCIAEFHTQERPAVTIAGLLPGVQCGETLDLVGQWKHHPQHGPRFQFHRFSSRLPSSLHGIRKYLGSGLVPGIGKTYADKIVEHFGTDTLRIISEESARLREIPGIGATRAKAIKKAWDEQAALRDVMMFLKTYGVSTAQCLRLVRTYGQNATTLLKTEPYRIAREIDGIGFKTADRIALNLGIPSDSDNRLRAGLLFALHELESEGHTCLPRDTLLSHTSTLLDTDPTLLTRQLDILLAQREILLLPDTPTLQLPSLERAEDTIAQRLAALQHSSGSLPPIHIEKALEWAYQRAGLAFAPEQTQALRQALQHKITLLTGGPGTGKTTLLRALTDILQAKKVRLTLAAPTGRAAQRMSEATRTHARTIHRLLEWDPQAGQFLHNQQRPLKTDFLILDETSMLDTHLAAALLRAIPDTAHLLLVGDTHQLPSVGPGNFLADLLATGHFPATALRQIFRQHQRSGIITTAHDLLNGHTSPPPPTTADALDPHNDLHFIQTASPEDTLDTLVRLHTRELPRLFKADPFADMQVLAPMHKGPCGTTSINQALQNALNPRTAEQTLSFGDLRFRTADKVIQTRNNYDKNIFNGEIGRIQTFQQENQTLTATFDDGPVTLERTDLAHLQLAYAITIHKSQGSEFPIVIIPLLRQHFVMLQRNLLYTALTRGRRKVFLVGDPSAYAMAARNTSSQTRHTHLRQKITARLKH